MKLIKDMEEQKEKLETDFKSNEEIQKSVQQNTEMKLELLILELWISFLYFYLFFLFIFFSLLFFLPQPFLLFNFLFLSCVFCNFM